MTNSNTAASDQKTLTVVVVDAKSQPASGAHVSIKPSDASGVTNSAGEFQFKLGNALKYDITAEADSKTVTVPYYLTPNGATRLVVNPVYVKSVEARSPSQQQLNMGFLPLAGAVIGAIVVLAVIWKFSSRRKPGANKNTNKK